MELPRVLIVIAVTMVVLGLALGLGLGLTRQSSSSSKSSKVSSSQISSPFPSVESSSSPSNSPFPSAEPSSSPFTAPSLNPSAKCVWEQIGQDIYGEAAGNLSGENVSLSDDGTTVAIGATRNKGNGSDSGHVRVFQYDNVSKKWFPMGQDIDGEATKDYSGSSVSLSEDGTTVSIGATSNDGNGSAAGHVRVFKYNDVYKRWFQMGEDIDGEAAFDRSGWSVSLSRDGTIVSIGSVSNDGNGSSSGHVRVFQYDTASKSWLQLGKDINGLAALDESGRSISLSDDGFTVAIGATGTTGVYGSTVDDVHAGHVRVFQYDNVSKIWLQLGQNIDGEDVGDYSGSSVSLSDNGTTVAIGARWNDGNGDRAGHVRVFQYDDVSKSWLQMGQDIDGEATGDDSGYSISLSDDGGTVAIGATGNEGNGSDAGHVRVFQYDNLSKSWLQLGHDIDGQTAGDRSGYSVSLSDDGTTVAIGAPQNEDDDDDGAGQVRVYHVLCT